MAINTAAIERALQDVFGDFARGQDAAYKAAIADDLYSWPNETQRRNGETAGRTRNIVDIGDLRNSQSVQISGLEAVYSWDVDYAAIVFFGYTTTAGNSYPGRNWIGASHQQSDPTEALGRACRRVFN